jgi:hypothetical protein
MVDMKYFSSMDAHSSHPTFCIRISSPTHLGNALSFLHRCRTTATDMGWNPTLGSLPIILPIVSAYLHPHVLSIGIG